MELFKRAIKIDACIENLRFSILALTVIYTKFKELCINKN
jgi:hypothetical protein